MSCVFEPTAKYHASLSASAYQQTPVPPLRTHVVADLKYEGKFLDIITRVMTFLLPSPWYDISRR